MKTPAQPAARIPAAAAALILALLSGCGAQDPIVDGGTGGNAGAGTGRDDTPGDGDATVAIDHIVVPPKGYYDALFADALNRVDGGNLSLAGEGAPQTLWVNFDGARVTKGFGGGQSFILCQQQATLPRAALSAAERDRVLQLVQEYYDTAGARLVVTAQKPSAGDFTTVHVGGSYADLGCRGARVLGVAPFDDGNANRNDVAFAFTAGVDDPRIVADTIAHEAGHSFGLEHVVDSRDLMFASASPDIAGFGVSQVQGAARVQDAPAKLQAALGADGGGGAPAPAPAPAPGPTPQQPAPPVAIPGLPNLPASLAGLPGLIQLANVGGLLGGLQGAGGAPLDLSQLLPLIQALAPVGASLGGLTGLGQIITLVSLASQANQTLGNVPGGLGGAAGGALGGLLSGAGFGNIGAAVSALQTLLAPQPGAGGQVALPAQFPDLGLLLGLGNNPATLINGLLGSAAVVNGNFQGVDRDALTSLLKVAYAQQYGKI